MARRKKPKKVTRPKIEEKVAQFLTELHLSYKHNARIGKYNVDFLVDDKYIIECYGDFFHCNPKKYAPTDYNKVLKCTAQDRWQHDQLREQELRNKGYRFMVLWENEIAYHDRHCRNKIKSLLTNPS